LTTTPFTKRSCALETRFDHRQRFANSALSRSRRGPSNSAIRRRVPAAFASRFIDDRDTPNCRAPDEDSVGAIRKQPQ
jgi:hypothetical protein